MKKFFAMSIAALFAFTASAQDFDTDPTVKIDNEEQQLHFKLGARMISDAAWYHSDFTPLKSGASLTDTRLRAGLNFNNWYLFADMGFVKGQFKQKNIFLQYTLEGNNGNHIFKGGYYNDCATMAKNTSIASYHFISRPAPVNALQGSRQLGLTYKFYNDNFMAYQGVYAENMYNNQEAGSQGVTLSGRYLYLPVNNGDETLHFGINGRFQTIGTGKVVSEDVLQRHLAMGTSFETNVDASQLCQADLLWAKNVTNLGAEFLYHNEDMFLRGEYMYRHVTKSRDSWALFQKGLGGQYAWDTFESWSKANPLVSNNFQGAYVEAGYKIFGDNYAYNKADGTLKGLTGNTLEVVARYSYLDLDDLDKSELYVAGRDQYYPGGIVADWPYKGVSVGGGKMHNITVGLNYSFNKYVTAMVDYGFSRLDRDKYPMDKNFHKVEGRVIFNF